MTNIIALIEQGLAQLDLPLPEDSAARLARFVELMRKWNRAHNLTAITEPRAMVARHVLDSLAGAPWVRGRRVLDVGSGAGLPGIPLAIAEPSRRVSLLDSRGKRVQFLLHARQVLALGNVDVVQERFEKYRPHGGFDTLTARAFAALPDLIRPALPFITAGARLVVWQRNDPSGALDEALAGEPVRREVHAVRVPGIQAPRHIVVIEGAGKPPQEPSGSVVERPE